MNFSKIIILSVIITSIILCYNKTYAQSSPEEITETFFTIFENDMSAAVDYLFSTNELIDPNQPGIKSIKEKMEVTRKLLGNFYGYETVNIYYAGESYQKHIYSIKYERQPVKMTIIYYKPNNKWKVQSLNFQDDIDSELRLK